MELYFPAAHCTRAREETGNGGINVCMGGGGSDKDTWQTYGQDKQTDPRRHTLTCTVTVAELLTVVPLRAVTVHSTVTVDPPWLSCGAKLYIMAALVPTAAPFRVHAQADAVFPAAWVAVNCTFAPPTVARVEVGAMVTPRVTVNVATLETAVPRAWVMVHTMEYVGPLSASEFELAYV
jgi:hypothetical protein